MPLFWAIQNSNTEYKAVQMRQRCKWALLHYWYNLGGIRKFKVRNIKGLLFFTPCVALFWLSGKNQIFLACG